VVNEGGEEIDQTELSLNVTRGKKGQIAQWQATHRDDHNYQQKLVSHSFFQLSRYL